MLNHAEIGRLGGLARSEAKAMTLAALHASRRGKRVNSGIPRELIRRVLILLQQHHEPGRISRRQLAIHCGVSDRTVRRWLAGVDWPKVEAAKQIGLWIRSLD